MKKYEYRSENMNENGFFLDGGNLNFLARQGWQVISVVAQTSERPLGSLFPLWVLLEREVENETKG